MRTALEQLLHSEYGFDAGHLDELIRRAPFTYKFYSIPKRTGGVRMIAHPARETKLIQRWLVSNVFGSLPLHESATAYRIGAGIKKNALVHAPNPYLAKFDFRNFFGSISSSDLSAFLRGQLATMFCEKDIERIAHVSCVKLPTEQSLCLSVGAPSSPCLSNSIMFQFDQLVGSWASSEGFAYTRYADDLTFSTARRNTTNSIEPFLAQVLSSLSIPTLRLNTKKTLHTSKKFQRRVTGLVLDNSSNVSLGRDRKREISSLVHRYKCGTLGVKEKYYVQGLLGFASDIEPIFIERLKLKYGSDVLSEIFSLRKPKDEDLRKLLYEQLGIPF